MSKPVRKHCASVSAVISIRSKPASRLQAFCSSSIRKRRIRALVYALRRTPSPGCIHAGANLFYVCDHLADIALLDRHLFLNQMEKRSSTHVHLTCSPRPRLPSWLPPAIKVASDSLAITTLAVLLRSVSPPYWCSPSQRSRSVASGR